MFQQRHTELLGRKLIALVRRGMPGVRAQMYWENYDQTLSVVFRHGSRLHAVRISKTARSMPPGFAKGVWHALRLQSPCGILTNRGT